MNHFANFAEFVDHARLAMEAFHGQLMEEPKISDEDRRRYHVMVSALAIKWLVRSGDAEALTQLRDQITDALRGSKQLQ